MNSFRKRINIYKFSLILSYSESVLLYINILSFLEELKMDSFGYGMYKQKRFAVFLGQTFICYFVALIISFWHYHNGS